MRCRQRGLSLIELIIFIIIVGTALAGVLTVLNLTTKSSADPMVRKQVLAIAEAILEEVQLQPFTHCHPSDSKAATATEPKESAEGCSVGLVQGLGAGGSARIANTDNVGDYAGVTLSPVSAVDGAHTHTGYSATITVAPQTLGPSGSEITSAACASATDCSALKVLRIEVTASGGGTSITLEGYRARHSPNLLP
jgi:MSHA pilin protein MshD